MDFEDLGETCRWYYLFNILNNVRALKWQVAFIIMKLIWLSHILFGLKLFKRESFFD